MFKIKIGHTFLILSLYIFCNPLNAQSINKAIDGLENWYQNFPQEKTFLQIDKNQLVAGDQIWFKAWCTFNSKPSFLSKIMYVDLINEAGTVVQKKMFSMDSSASISGVLDIDTKVKTGNYRINAYTLWMLNSPDFIAKQSLFIYGSDYINKPVTPSKILNLKAQFFPEGGNMIAGINNRIAFKITDDNANPISTSGVIVDKDNQQVASFSTEHDGMGLFELEPKNGGSYFAIIKKGVGSSQTFKLPIVKNEGINMMVYNSSNRISVIINRGDFNKDKYNKSILIAHMNGKLIFAGEFDFNEGKTATSISKKGLQPGIVHITVFDSAANPLVERIAFIENYSVQVPAINNDIKNLNKRGKNAISFQLANTVNEDLSVLVKTIHKTDSIQNTASILSSLLLSADLKGFIPNSHYYFSNKSEPVLKHLDLLMMTHGWRRFTWNNLVNKIDPVLKYPIESNISIKGKVTKSNRSDLIKDGKVSFILKGEDSTKIVADAFLTDKGEFILDSLKYKKKATIYFEAQNNKREKIPVDVTIYPAYIDTVKKSSFIAEINLDTSMISYRNNSFSQYIYNRLGTIDTLLFGNTTLAGVTVTTKKLSFIDSLQKEYVSPVFAVSDNTIDFENATGMINIWQYLRGQIPGFSVEPFNGGGATARFTRYDGIRGLSDDEGLDAIKFMLNEIEVSPEQLDFISPNDVALVKVYKGNTAFAWGANMGMIAVYTKKGTIVKKSPYEKTFAKLEKIGFENDREFFNIDYIKMPDLNKNIIDNRQTLYWNPKIKKDKSGKYSFSYYNNDLTESNLILIQGIDNKGQIIYSQKIIN
jgi:hypothetical protein